MSKIRYDFDVSPGFQKKKKRKILTYLHTNIPRQQLQGILDLDDTFVNKFKDLDLYFGSSRSP